MSDNASHITARALLDAGAFLIRPNETFRLTSGLLAPIYVNCRLILGHARARAAIAAALAAAVLGATARPTAVDASEPVRAAQHMVAAANPHAARAGRAVLRAGGSAIDAAIAAEMVLSLVEPQSSGIGGGAFLIHYAAESGAIDAYDGRETAPKSANPYLFLDGTGKPRDHRDAAIGGIAVGVPGLLRMLEMAHKDYGRLPWRDLFTPAIDLAGKGFPISKR